MKGISHDRKPTIMTRKLMSEHSMQSLYVKVTCEISAFYNTVKLHHVLCFVSKEALLEILRNSLITRFAGLRSTITLLKTNYYPIFLEKCFENFGHFFWKNYLIEVLFCIFHPYKLNFSVLQNS